MRYRNFRQLRKEPIDKSGQPYSVGIGKGYSKNSPVQRHGDLNSMFSNYAKIANKAESTGYLRVLQQEELTRDKR